jgi:hypothetical protein
MKKILLSFVLAFSLFAGNLASAQGSKIEADMDSSSEKGNPSIKIEFENFEKFSEDLSKDGEKFDDKTIEISYEEAGLAGGLLALGLGFLLLILLLSIACFVFWIMMIVHAISKPIKSKALWIIILLLFGIIGAIVYYFAVKRQFKKAVVDEDKSV